MFCKCSGNPLDDFTSTCKSGFSTPRSELDLAIDQQGVAGDGTTLNGRPKGRELMPFVFNDPDFDLALTNASCLHDSLRLDDSEAVQHDVCCSAASVPIKRVSQNWLDVGAGVWPFGHVVSP